mmetsp:Transcript_16425/g.52449  ORF Transcript_16425/g.52449 Transcript_16425/m.52449 type:complete len:225 (-) Transcript_16425:182-856(-)
MMLEKALESFWIRLGFSSSASGATSGAAAASASAATATSASASAATAAAAASAALCARQRAACHAPIFVAGVGAEQEGRHAERLKGTASSNTCDLHTVILIICSASSAKAPQMARRPRALPTPSGPRLPTRPAAPHPSPQLDALRCPIRRSTSPANRAAHRSLRGRSAQPRPRAAPCRPPLPVHSHASAGPRAAATSCMRPQISEKRRGRRRCRRRGKTQDFRV